MNDNTNSDSATSDSANSQSADPMAFMQLLWPGPMLVQAIRTAAHLKIADHLAGDAKAIEELAAAASAQEKTLRRLLTALSSAGLFSTDAGGKWRNTPLSEFMREDHPQSMRSWALIMGAEFFWRPMGELPHAVVTGRESFTSVFPAGFFQYLKDKPDAGTLFNQAMAAQSAGWMDEAPGAYDFSQFSTLIDVGGGTGSFLAMLLRAYPALRGVLLELPDVIAEVPQALTDEFGERLTLEGSSFFDSVPQALDCYVTVRVIHDWPDDQAVKILKNIRKAINPDGTLLLFEGVLEPDAPPNYAMMDMLMLVLAGAMERTEEDFRTLLANGGFALKEIIRKGHLRILECKPV